MSVNTPNPLSPGLSKAELFRSFRANGTGGGVHDDILPANRSNQVPLTSDQRRFWFLHQLAPAAYNDCFAIRLTGELCTSSLRKALNALVQRHESLRTTFKLTNGQPVQIIGPPFHVELPETDATLSTDSDSLFKFAADDAQQPFDLDSGPLFRVRLLRQGELGNVLLLTIHHIVSDGHSFGILFRELASIYDALQQGTSIALPVLKTQMADYAVWEQNCLRNNSLAHQVQFWKRAMTGYQRADELPPDRPRPLVQEFAGAGQDADLPEDLVQALLQLGKSRKTGLYVIILAAYQTLMYSFTRSPCVCVGMPVSRRTRPELQNATGLYVNTLPLLVDLSGVTTFTDLIERTRDMCLQCLEHRDVPFEQIVRTLNTPRDMSRNPLFQTIVVHEKTPEPIRVGDLTFSYELLPYSVVRGDLALWVVEKVGSNGSPRVTLRLQYNTGLFDPETISRIMDRLNRLLSIVVSGTMSLGDLADKLDHNVPSKRTNPRVSTKKQISHTKRRPMGRNRSE